MRIFQTRHDLPRSELAGSRRSTTTARWALIAEAIDAQGVPETLGVARTLSDPDQVEAEFAIVVRSDLKGADLRTLLFERLIEHARCRSAPMMVPPTVCASRC